jgi:hypothetical protein
MRSLVPIIIIGITTFILGYSIDASANIQTIKNTHTLFYIWPLFLITVISGAFGGFVHALETENTHGIKFTVNGKETDSGVWGHTFVGICGSIVALAIMIAIFGLKIDPLITNNNPVSNVLQTSLFIAAIGIVGGYSGLPIISLISNAALKKVQKQVDALETSDASKQKKIVEVTTDLHAMSKSHDKLQNELTQKNQELRESKLTGILLLAESSARNGFFEDAITALKNDYLPIKADDHRVYHWLAFCEKRLGNLEKAIEYAKKSISLKDTRLGYFNLACYINLLDSSKDQVYDALNKAWNSCESTTDKNKFIDGLQNDKDFTNLRVSNDKGFSALVDKYTKLNASKI